MLRTITQFLRIYSEEAIQVEGKKTCLYNYDDIIYNGKKK